MKKLFLLPLLAFVMLFTSCEKVELFDGVIEPCLDFGASADVVDKYMSKYDIDLLSEDLTENDDYYGGDYLFLQYGNYGDCKYFYYDFIDDRLTDASMIVDGSVYKKVVEQLDAKYILHKETDRGTERKNRFYVNKEKTFVVFIVVPNDFEKYEDDGEGFQVSYISKESVSGADIIKSLGL